LIFKMILIHTMEVWQGSHATTMDVTAKGAQLSVEYKNMSFSPSQWDLTFLIGITCEEVNRLRNYGHKGDLRCFLPHGPREEFNVGVERARYALAPPEYNFLINFGGGVIDEPGDNIKLE